MPFKDHFQTLRISHRATPQQLQKAYYDRLKFFHPDYFQDDPPRRAIAETETKCLNEAFEVLGKPEVRQQYITEWERHHSAQRPPERSLAVEQSLTDARTNLNFARRQITELKSTLERRDRELEAANLGLRQSYQRVTHLQDTAQTLQESTRFLQAQVVERELELQQSRGRVDGLERHVTSLQAEIDQAREDELRAKKALDEYRVRLAQVERQMADRDRQLGFQQRRGLAPNEQTAPQHFQPALPEALEPADQTQLQELRRAVSTAEESLRLRRADAEQKAAEVMQLKRLAALAQERALERALEQESLLGEAANRIRSLQERLLAAEADIACDSSGARPGGADPVGVDGAQEAQRQRSQMQELAAALAQRTEEARLAQARAQAQEEHIRFLESARRADGRAPTGATASSRPSHLTDRAAGWRSPQRATTIMTGLLLALCVVAVTLVLLTVSIDLPALATGLGRLGTALSGLIPK